jgi:protease-4
MVEGGGQWERDLIEKLAMAALREQRRARQWGIFFKLLGFAFLAVILLLAFDWRGRTEAAGGKHTALVELSGLIAPGADASADNVIAALDAAFKDRNTRGVVLRIDSPGGSPVQAQDIYQEMLRLRHNYPKIPLYAVVQDICASGGYYVAVGADKIFVSPNSIIGSIGVRIDSFGLTGLMQKLGIERRLLTAGSNKGFLDPFSPEDPKQKQYALAMLEEVHQQFIKVVREGRGKRLKETPDMFSGLIWTGQQGVELGLADGYGTLGSVARDVIGAKEIVDYTRKESLAEKLARRFGAGAASALATFALREDASPALR